jgi:hypothetical protein
VILGAEAVQRRIDALQSLDAAFLGLHEAGQSLEDLQGGLSIDGAQSALA